MATELYLLQPSGVHTTEYWQNDIYFVGENLNAGDVIANANDLISNWMNNAHASFLALLPGSVSVERYTCRRQDVAGGIDVVKQFDYFTEIGTVASNASSQQLCPVVRLIPPMGTKSAGRFFLASIAETDIANNVPIAGWVTRLATLMTTLLAGMNDGAITWTIGIYSRKNQSHVKALDYDTSPIVGWQSRRRKPF